MEERLYEEQAAPAGATWLNSWRQTAATAGQHLSSAASSTWEVAKRVTPVTVKWGTYFAAGFGLITWGAEIIGPSLAYIAIPAGLAVTSVAVTFRPRRAIAAQRMETLNHITDNSVHAIERFILFALTANNIAQLFEDSPEWVETVLIPTLSAGFAIGSQYIVHRREQTSNPHFLLAFASDVVFEPMVENAASAAGVLDALGPESADLISPHQIFYTQIGLLGVGMLNGITKQIVRSSLAKHPESSISSLQKGAIYTVNLVDSGFAVIKNASIFMVMVNITNELKSYSQHCGGHTLAPIHLNTTRAFTSVSAQPTQFAGNLAGEDPRCDLAASFVYGTFALYASVIFVPATAVTIAQTRERVLKIQSAKAQNTSNAALLLEFGHHHAMSHAATQEQDEHSPLVPDSLDQDSHTLDEDTETTLKETWSFSCCQRQPHQAENRHGLFQSRQPRPLHLFTELNPGGDSIEIDINAGAVAEPKIVVIDQVSDSEDEATTLSL